MKKFISFLLFVCCCSIGWAQVPKAGDVISGTVEDDIEPLMLVNVVEIDKNKRIVAHGVTDINGNFSFKIVNPKDHIQVSYVGYATQTLPITKKHFRIVMKSSTVLKTVEIKATKKTQTTGLSIPVTEISGATSTIDMKEFEGLAMTSVDEALQGRISGLDIVMNSGDLGAGTTMRLRGVSTINADANPLIVVNGNVWTSDALSDFDFSNANEERFAELLSVNPEDIETITVLKDAAATAIWGSQGGNGVIEIKTKRGRKGKTRVDYSFRMTATWLPEAYKLLNGDDYTMYMKESFFNPQLNSTYADRTEGNTNFIPEINYYENFSEHNMYDDNTDWVDLVKQTGVYQQHFVSLTGGGEKAQFRVSAGYDNQKGSIIKQHLDRFTTRVALDYYVSDRITVKTNFDMNYTKNQKNYTGLLAIALNKMPNLSPYLEDENGNDTGTFYTMNRYATRANYTFLSEQYNMANPLAVAENAKNNDTEIRLTPEFILKYDVLGTEESQTRLTYEGQVTFNISNSDNETYYPGNLIAANWASDNYNSASTSSYKSNSFSTRHTLTFIPYFKNENHKAQFMARMNWNQGNSSSQYTSVKWLPTSDITSPYGGGYYNSPSTGFGEWKSMWYLFSAHYAYKGKYIFDATLRRDAVTKFGPSHRWGNFPGLSARWNISDEPFMENFSSWLDMLSIRPGWGKTGRQPGSDYLYFSKYSNGNTYIGDNSVYPNNIRLGNLKWEWQETFNLGFDLGVFRKWEARLELYTSKSTDLLMGNYSIPSSSGYSSLSYRNTGSMRNTGWELSVDGRNIIKRGKFSMDVNLTFANNRNEILSMDPTVLESMNGDFNFKNGSYLSRVQINNPLGAIYGFRYKGVYQYSEYSEEEDKGVSGPNAPVVRDAAGNVVLSSSGNPKYMYFDYGGANYAFEGGDAIYEDINHDGNIDELDIVYLGSSLPKLTGGFGFRLKYGRLSANVQFNYRLGQKVINYARMDLENMATSNNQSRAVNWRWHTEGDSWDNILPRALTTKTNFASYNYLGSDRFVEDASFLRLNYLNISYAVNEKTLKRWGLSRLSFYLTFNNLFVITKYSGADPEINQGGYAPASDSSKTPRSKSVTFGASVSF